MTGVKSFEGLCTSLNVEVFCSGFKCELHICRRTLEMISEERTMCSKILIVLLIANFGINCVATQQIIYPGNVTVVGLFEIFEPENGGCGSTLVTSSVMEAEAVKWYLRKLTEAGDLPFNIGVHGYATCRQSSLAARVAVDVMSQSYRQTNDGQNTILGIIGPSYSSEAEVVAPILSSAEAESRLLMMGYSTTSVSLNSTQYPNFYRVVPNDDIQINMMVQSLREMGWNRIAIIYENDIYGQQAMQSLTQKSASYDICVAYTAHINTRNGIDSQEIEDISRSMLIGSSERPPIHGFVFFGSSSTANLLLQKINSLGFSNVPIGLFSDGINMDIATFQNLNRVISKTKGSLITSPSYRVIEEFHAHWKDIFTNPFIFGMENETNPWLNDLYFQLKPCDQQPCDFVPLTHSEFDETFSEQPLYVQYAVLAAHTMAKAFKLKFEESCPGGPKTCDFPSIFKAGDMIEQVQNIQLDFTTDFSVRLETLGEVQLRFQGDGEPDFGSSTAEYQLFNLRHANITSGEITFVKVADFENGVLRLDTDDIIDYNDDGSPTAWPNVRTGQCGPNELCQTCIPDDLPFQFIHEPGDVYLVGLVPVYDRSGSQDCGNIRTSNGYQLVESIKFAVSKMNEPGGTYQDYFQGATVGVIILNTCNNPAVIQRHILNLQKDGLKLQDGSVVPLHNRILGYAGPLGSTNSIAVSSILASLNKVSISYASTSPTLSNRDIYKYFMRVVSPDNEQANAMANILEELNANYVQALYSEGAYGEAGIATLRDILKSKGICIIQDIKVPESDSYYEYYENLRRYPHAKIVIIFLRSHVVKPLMNTLKGQMSQGEFVFIGSEAWGKSAEILENDSKKALLGSYSIVVEMAEKDTLLTSVQRINPQPYSENPWSQKYLQTKWQCYYNDSYNKQFPEVCRESFASETMLDGWATPAYTSALSMLIGSGDYLKSVCGPTVTELCADYLNNPQGLVSAIKDVMLDVYGTGIKQRVFNNNGDGNVGYAIYNIQKVDGSPQQLQYRKVGQYPLIGSFTFDKNLIVYPTNVEIISQCPNQQACAGCVESPGGIIAEEKEGGLSVSLIIVLVLFFLSLIAVAVLAFLLYRMKRQDNKEQVYLTPATPAEERSKTNYLIMPDSERPAAVGESTEKCTEPPHKTHASTVLPPNNTATFSKEHQSINVNL